ncbi:MAG: hypothetical protein EAZ60_29785 [Oscillatoriales cyanobacterium]|uniref:hypothetical protein n=1 Tax=unclassified Microcoleus TaxID=2642155 RepID=UPI001DC021B1|nr:MULTISPECIES: hypothetical protein [unclassified Microcoleus]MCC3459301.1 hypothetical protein [Microcoleus sp. PH2017_11_PCY_U_A]TAE84442.1 MAG: hypothetical protein EAZ83_05655 [Oscillatoriales cyanobacterium]MCC3558477.1 hypothetical protein [Microcoleus sp. PH2017_27_LUM_O_A]TAE97764.1 MAG: hypothetical protein EAZ79_09700 [Oscillatoriales cyanobacterium]TAF17973.1 MAG: hypothetical protein EAZ73_19520 [Oscillatoriales cyanobacterium]
MQHKDKKICYYVNLSQSGLELVCRSCKLLVAGIRGVSDSLPILRDDAQPIGILARKEILWNFWR